MYTILVLLQVNYYNSKDLPEDFPLKKYPTFSKTFGINKNYSVVHIPTDVYSGGEIARKTASDYFIIIFI